MRLLAILPSALGACGEARPATRLALLSAAGLIAAIGCEPGEPESGVTVRDSAGVTIVENHRPLWDEGAAWEVGTAAIVRIGVVDGEPAYQFSGVTGGARLADGTVVVADGGSQQIRFFDPGGRFRRAVGGPGEGPGEFSGLSALGHAPGGGLWAYDFALRRITWLGSTGEVDGMTSLGPDPPVVHPLGVLPDRTAVFRELWGAQAVAGASRAGLRRDPVAFVRFDSTGALLDTIGLFPGREIFLHDEDGRSVMSTPLFGRNSVGAVRNGRIVVGSQDAFELEELTPDGTRARRVRILGRDRTLSREEVGRAIDARLEAGEPERRADLRRTLEAMPTPETRPAYGGMFADASGNLWIEEWAPNPSLPGAWTIVLHDGRWLGSVDAPEDFYPLDIGEGWILGVERDELGVEYVSVLPINKPSSSASSGGNRTVDPAGERIPEEEE